MLPICRRCSNRRRPHQGFKMNSDSESLDQFAKDFQQQVVSGTEVEAEGAFQEAVFTQLMIDYLGDAGELENADVCLHRAKAKGIQISGYALSDNGESLDIIVAIH